MGMLKVVGSKIKSFTKETVKQASKMCVKCGKVLGLEEQECNCGKEREGQTNRSNDNQPTN